MIDIQSTCGACMHAAVCVYRKSVDSAAAAILKIKEELDHSPIVGVEIQCEHYQPRPYIRYTEVTCENSSSACAEGTAVK